MARWATNVFSSYFLLTKNKNTLNNYVKLVQWAENENQYSRNAKDEFMKEDNADPWLIAHAVTDKNSFKIVTFEKLNNQIKRKIPIPNVCNAFNIQYCDLFTMMKDLNFKF